MERLARALSRWIALCAGLAGLLAAANFTRVFNRLADDLYSPRRTDQHFLSNGRAILNSSL